MLDFTSALYLGFRHASSSLPAWESLTAGVPAALAEPPEASAVAQRLASLIGCARARLAPSTLHLFWDAFASLPSRHTSIHVDEAAYPIARWGVERAQARGVPTHTFHHRDPDALLCGLLAAHRGGLTPIVLCDGYCPGCGPSPLPLYAELAGRFGGLLVIDDTQALGILGEGGLPESPFGRGGGGSLRWQGLAAANVLVGASLAKAFGVPVAVMAGDPAAIRRFEENAETRVHCSQPSLAAVAAAHRALALNETIGDAVRTRLAALVGRLRAAFAGVGQPPRGGAFPVQVLDLGHRTQLVHEELLRLGVSAPLHRDLHTARPVISFLITARHRESDIDAAAASLARAVARAGRHQRAA